MGQYHHETQDYEQHHKQLAGVMVRVNVSVSDGAERDQHEPDGVEEMELTVYQLDTVQETDPVCECGECVSVSIDN